MQQIDVLHLKDGKIVHCTVEKKIKPECECECECEKPITNVPGNCMCIVIIIKTTTVTVSPYSDSDLCFWRKTILNLLVVFVIVCISNDQFLWHMFCDSSLFVCSFGSLALRFGLTCKLWIQHWLFANV